MRDFIKKGIKFSFLPLGIFLILILIYLVQDPFKVVRDYDNYNIENGVGTNRDHISCKMFVQNNGRLKYNSFIFGSSRTLAYSPTYWKSKLESTARPFSFDATAETIYGIHAKVKYLDSIGVNIDNALLIICRDYTFARTTNTRDHVSMKHPIITNESNLDYQIVYLKAYFAPEFLASYLPYSTTGLYFDYMKAVLSGDPLKLKYDSITNRLIKFSDNKAISENSEAFYEAKAHRFYRSFDKHNRLIKEVVLPAKERIEKAQKIKVKELKMLTEIEAILRKHNSNYKLVLHPLLDKVKFSIKDKVVMKSLFGNHMYDFTGNNSYTDSYKDYYDWSHIRPFKGELIMDSIYNVN